MKKLTPLFVFVILVGSFLLIMKTNADKRPVMSNTANINTSSTTTQERSNPNAEGNSNVANGYSVEFLPTKVSLKKDTKVEFKVNYKEAPFLGEINYLLVVSKNLRYSKYLPVEKTGNSFKSSIPLKENGEYFIYLSPARGTTLGYQLVMTPAIKDKAADLTKVSPEKTYTNVKSSGKYITLLLDKNFIGKIDEVEYTTASKVTLGDKYTILVKTSDFSITKISRE